MGKPDSLHSRISINLTTAMICLKAAASKVIKWSKSHLTNVLLSSRTFGLSSGLKSRTACTTRFVHCFASSVRLSDLGKQPFSAPFQHPSNSPKGHCRFFLGSGNR
uniref:Uncharacterized protein n=1 Tax=Micrurus corallinus TaxID=54390 RepID=A0A2D4F7M2_MICCO